MGTGRHVSVNTAVFVVIVAKTLFPSSDATVWRQHIILRPNGIRQQTTTKKFSNYFLRVTKLADVTNYECYKRSHSCIHKKHCLRLTKYLKRYSSLHSSDKTRRSRSWDLSPTWLRHCSLSSQSSFHLYHYCRILDKEVFKELSWAGRLTQLSSQISSQTLGGF